MLSLSCNTTTLDLYPRLTLHNENCKYTAVITLRESSLGVSSPGKLYFSVLLLACGVALTPAYTMAAAANVCQCLFHSALTAFSCFAEGSFPPLHPFPLPPDARIDAQQTMFRRSLPIPRLCDTPREHFGRNSFKCLKTEGKGENLSRFQRTTLKTLSWKNFVDVFIFPLFPLGVYVFYIFFYFAVSLQW